MSEKILTEISNATDEDEARKCVKGYPAIKNYTDVTKLIDLFDDAVSKRLSGIDYERRINIDITCRGISKSLSSVQCLYDNYYSKYNAEEICINSIQIYYSVKIDLWPKICFYLSTNLNGENIYIFAYNERVLQEVCAPLEEKAMEYERWKQYNKSSLRNITTSSISNVAQKQMQIKHTDNCLVINKSFLGIFGIIAVASSYLSKNIEKLESLINIITEFFNLWK